MAHQVDEYIRSFLDEHVREYTKIEALLGDASTRLYYRVFAGAETYILCRDSGFINVPESNYSFKIVYDLLKHAVPVPEVFAMDSANGLLLLQDLGDDLLEYQYPLFNEDMIASIYTSCIENLFSIQMIRGEGDGPFSLSFNVEKLMYEFIFFIEHALRGYFAAQLSDADAKALAEEFMHIATLLHQPRLFVLNHRDYHSRNIIMHDDIPYIIDFQDARMGLPQYDLVSLLRDSYVRLSPHLFEYLKKYYYEGGKDMGIHAMGPDEFEYYFDMMAFQRNIKALGTFGYQVNTRGNKLYAKYIRPTAAYLGDYAERQDDLKQAWSIVCRYISSR